MVKTLEEKALARVLEPATRGEPKMRLAVIAEAEAAMAQEGNEPPTVGGEAAVRRRNGTKGQKQAPAHLSDDEVAMVEDWSTLRAEEPVSGGALLKPLLAPLVAELQVQIRVIV